VAARERDRGGRGEVFGPGVARSVGEGEREREGKYKKTSDLMMKGTKLLK
jgi:hypothetical protein